MATIGDLISGETLGRLREVAEANENTIDESIAEAEEVSPVSTINEQVAEEKTREKERIFDYSPIGEVLTFSSYREFYNAIHTPLRTEERESNQKPKLRFHGKTIEKKEGGGGFYFELVDVPGRYADAVIHKIDEFRANLNFNDERAKGYYSKHPDLAIATILSLDNRNIKDYKIEII